MSSAAVVIDALSVKENGLAFRGSNSASLIFTSLPKGNQLLKENNYSCRNEVSPLVVVVVLRPR